jgi:hypothetical protein
LMNDISRARRVELRDQFFVFLQSLCEQARVRRSGWPSLLALWSNTRRSGGPRTAVLPAAERIRCGASLHLASSRLMRIAADTSTQS